jgi:4a-hydroxytetrahydrobiopterin dehydratase
MGKLLLYDSAMEQCSTAEELRAKACLPCEGGVPKLTQAQAEAQLACLSGWSLTHDATRIRRDWTLADFRSAIKLANAIAALAEREQHHPDLHIEGYRRLWIELSTHAIGGLSVNDFILAAKIDQIAPAARP